MSDPLRAALERAATLFKLRATGNDTEWGAAARTWLAEYAALVAPPPREEDDDPAMKGDGTDRLCRALYGRDAKPRDYLGGSEARMLYDAAERIEAAAPRDGNAERRAGAPPEERFALTTTGEATATVGDVRSAGGRERVTIMDPKAQRPSGPETARLIEFARSRAASARACATSPVAIGAGVASLWIAEAATFDAIAAALHAAGPQAPDEARLREDHRRMAGELTYWMGETRTVEREREGLREALIDAVNAFTSNSVTYVAQVSYERFMRWAAALAAPSRPQAPETAPETGEEAAVEDRARGLLRNAVTMAEQGAFVGDNVDRWLTNVYIALAYDRGAVRRAATPAQAPETGEEAQLAATMCGHCSADAAIRPAYRFCPMCGEPCVVAE